MLVLTSVAILLATALARRWRPRPGGHLSSGLVVPGVRLDRGLAAVLVGVAVVTVAVPFFSHANATGRHQLAAVMAATALLAAVAVVAGGRYGFAWSAVVAAAGTVAWTAWAIRVSPTPRIDVWVILQQAADGLARGENPYTTSWVGSPGIQDAFTYLPWTAVLVAPGRWLAGDVRWALLLAVLVALACLVATATPMSGRVRDTPPLVFAAATLLALAPGSITQAEQAWTEPLLLACLAGWALLIRRGRLWWAVFPLALGCACKQHLVVLLPVLACWPVFGWRRTLATGGLAGVLVLPWFLAAPADFWRDTVGLLISFHPIRFANTWFIAARTELDVTPPFWLTGCIVIAVVGTACWAVRRRQTDVADVVGWLALVLLIANLVNKQAFYNQYWLVGGLVALAVAAAAGAPRPDVRSAGSAHGTATTPTASR
ncbi:MAG: hypothetical protein ACRC35_09930 [Angustibacter sp.]